MTTITVIKSKNGEYKEVTCEGHADYAEAGSDIVCSAISILVINTINSISELTSAKMEVAGSDSGYICCRFTEVPDQGSTLLLDSMILGLKSITEQYGKKHLKLKFREV